MTRCKHIRYQLPEFVRGHLADDERADVSRHLDSCARCRRDLADLAIALQALQHDAQWKPEQSYWTSLLPRIHERIARRRPLRVREAVARLLAPVAAAAVVIVLVMGYLPTLMQTTHTQNFLSELTQVPKAELQDFVEQQTAVGISDWASVNAQSSAAENDNTVLKAILQSENSRVYSTETNDDESVIDVVPERDANQVLSILEKSVQTKVD